MSWFRKSRKFLDIYPELVWWKEGDIVTLHGVLGLTSSFIDKRPSLIYAEVLGLTEEGEVLLSLQQPLSNSYFFAGNVVVQLKKRLGQSSCTMQKLQIPGKYEGLTATHVCDKVTNLECSARISQRFTDTREAIQGLS